MGGGVIFFIGGAVANILNYIYRIVMGRMLGPEAFGELIALISLILILAVPSAPVVTAAARFSAVYQAKDFSQKLKSLFGYLTKVLSLVSLGIIILVLIFTSSLQEFLKLSSPGNLYFLAGIVVIMLIAGVSKGILQGLKRFSQLSFVFVLESVGRVGLAVFLVGLGFKINGALAGFLIPLIFGYFLAIFFLRDIFKSNQSEIIDSQGKGETKEIWKYILWSLSVFLFLNILLNVDIILVKHYFSGFEAGTYSAFSTLGRITFLAISLLAGILFPIVAFKQAKKEDYFHSLKIISLVSFLLVGIISLIFFFFPKEFLSLFFGPEYLEGIPFLGYYSLAMAIFGFIFLLSYFFMALNKFKFLYILAAGSILEIILISLWHANFLQVISVFSISLLITLCGISSLLVLEKKCFQRLSKK